MEFIDIHSHLALPAFDTDRAEVLAEAEKEGVLAILTAGENFEDNQKVLDVCTQYELLKPCLGFFPTNLDTIEAEKVETQIRENAESIVAISEVGLDYWKIQDAAEQETQREIFARFIALARELDKPLVVHSRSAGKATIEFLIEHNAERVCLHAFDGKFTNAQLGVEAGFFFSIPPSIVRSEQKQKLARQLPLENILLETDAPVLGPVKEERNVPENIRISAEKIAELKEISVEEVTRQTTEQAKKLLAGLV